MSRKRKKITVRVFANKRFPIEQLNGNSKQLYPAYVTVIYDQRNTKFKVTIDGLDILVEDRQGDLDKPEIQKFTLEIESIVRNEVSEKGDAFSLVGLSRRIEKYHNSLEKAFEELISRRLLEMVHFNLDVNKKYNVLKPVDDGKIEFEIADQSGKALMKVDNVTNFYIAVRILLSNVFGGKKKVFDWKFSNAKKELERKIEEIGTNLILDKGVITNMLDNYFDYYLWK